MEPTKVTQATVDLGYVGELVQQDTEFDSKWGGVPVSWDGSPVPSVSCETCQSLLAFVGQLSSPVGQYHRCFYVFGCNNVACKKQGWAMLRWTKLEEEEEKCSPTTNSEPEEKKEILVTETKTNLNTIDDWGATDGDWGIGTDDWGATGAAGKADTWGKTDTKEKKEALVMETKTNPNTDFGVTNTNDWGATDGDWGTGTNDWTTTTTTTTTTTATKTTSSDWDSEGTSDWGAAAPTLEDLLKKRDAALKEPKTEKKETPKKVIKKKQGIDHTLYKGSTFVPFYVEWGEEPLTQTLSKKDLQIVRKFKDFKVVDEDPEWAGEKYESSEDKTYSTFTKIINRSPQQCLRYGGEAVPIKAIERLPKRGSIEDIVPCCPHCKSRRKFEFQLMPPLIFLLKPVTLDPENVPEKGLDFGVVMCFTCSRNCQDDKVPFQTEYCIMQPGY
eukprot:TRINITY_DN2734_c0_g5_i1.p1 TRINITY_DN2734_c0_g5~~TRINITY_DN2734_c0_g5_i1.p1  ORF type:complete len:450 (-),score=97.43 TRINITY_DN2734_c0_g5_i1:9-1337(-)